MNQGTSRHERSSFLAIPRDALLSQIVRVALPAGVVALLPGALAAASEGIWLLVAIDIAAYCSIFVAWFLNRRGYTAAGAWVFVIAGMTVAATLLMTVGLRGASLIWLLAPLLFAELLLNRRGVVAILAVSISLLVIVAGMLAFDALPWSLDLTSWAAVSGSFVMVAVALLAAERFLINEVADLGLTERLLRQEIEHRVQNNLQLVISILRLEAAAQNDSERHENLTRIAERVAAMQWSFRIMQRRKRHFVVPVATLIGSVVGISVGADDSEVTLDNEVSLDSAVPLAIIANEYNAERTCSGARVTTASAGRVSIELAGISAPPQQLSASIVDVLASQVDAVHHWNNETHTVTISVAIAEA
jgi:two-component sensor histidine kinase